MKTLIAIGGGRAHSNLPIDRYSVEKTGKQSPKALFIPTASSDDEGYIEWFAANFGEMIGCETSVLTLVTENPSKEEIEDKIGSANLIYIGGGDTRDMVALWKKLGVDSLLKDAYDSGTVMSGLSAGSIYSFNYGHSDSESYHITPDPSKDEQFWDYIAVEGLHWHPYTVCPHYNVGPRLEDNGPRIGRRESFLEMIPKELTDHTCFGIEDNAAIVIEDGTMRAMTSEDNAAVWKLEWNGEKVEETRWEGDTL